MKMRLGYWLVTLKVLFFALGALWMMRSPATEELQNKAEEFFAAAQGAKTLFQREESLNQTLNALLQIYKKQENGLKSTAQLESTISFVTKELDNLPLALLFNYRAAKKAPRDMRLSHDSVEMRKELGLPFSIDANPLSHYALSTQEWWSIYRLLSLFMFASALAWFLGKKIGLMRRITLSFLVLWIGLGGYLLYERYLTPLRAVVIASTAVYAHPEASSTRVLNTPIRAGEVVDVIKMDPNTKWVKIVTQQQVVGYIPAEHIGVI